MRRKTIAQDLMNSLQQGNTLEKLASQRGYTAKAIEKAARGSSGAAPELLRAAFGMARPTKTKPLPAEVVGLSNGDVALVQLQDVAEGVTDSLNATQRSALVAQLQQGFGAAGFAALMENQRARAEIKRHQ